MSARLLLLLGVLSTGAVALAAPRGEAWLAPGAEWPSRLAVAADPAPFHSGDGLRFRLPGAPPVVLAGTGVALPSAPGREGSNQRRGFDLDPDGTPPPSHRPIPGAVASHRRVSLPAGNPTRWFPLFGSTIPPPLPT